MFDPTKEQGLDPEMFDKEDIQQVMDTTPAQSAQPAGEPVPSQQKVEQRREEEAAKALLQRQLGEGESVVWSGFRQAMHQTFSGIARKGFAFLWLGVAAFWELVAFMLLPLDMMGVLFRLVGLVFLFLGILFLFPGLFGKAKKRTALYAVTNQRVLAIYGERVVSWSLDRILSMEKKYYEDGTGDLILGNGETETHRDSNGHTHTQAVTLSLMGIVDVDGAEAAIRQYSSRI